MISSRTIDLLKALDRRELKQFGDFINSPVFNKDAKMRGLFSFLVKFYPDFVSPQLTKENVYKHIYGDKYSDTKFRKLLSNLLKLGEDFLSYKGYTQDKIYRKRKLLDQLNRKKLDGLFQTNYTAAKKIITEENAYDGNYFLELYILESLYVDFLIEKGRQTESGGNVKMQGAYIVLFFLSSILNIAHELLTQKEVLSSDMDTSYIETLLNRLNLSELVSRTKKEYPGYYPFVELYYNMYMTSIHKGTDKYITELEALIRRDLKKYSRPEQFNLLIIYEACAISKTLEGKPEYNRRLLEMYKFMLSNGVYNFTEYDYMQLNLFRGIFYTAILLKDYGWAETFIRDYKGKLAPKNRDTMFHYTSAALNFEKGEYEKALGHLNEVNNEYFIFKYDVKLMMMKIFYELNYYEQALAMISSFKNFLTSNKSLSLDYRQRFGNFLKIYRKLINLKERDGFAVNKLRKEIASAESIIAKKWLLEKVS